MRLHNSFHHVWAWHRTYLVLKKFYQNLEKHEASEGIGVLCQCCIKKIFDIIDLCVLWGHQDSVSHMAYIFRSFSRLRPTSNSYQSSAVCCWIWGWKFILQTVAKKFNPKEHYVLDLFDELRVFCDWNGQFPLRTWAALRPINEYID